MVQETSLEALTGIQNDKLGLSNRQLIVLSGLMYLGIGTNTMIARHLRLPINCVTGRVFELRKLGLIVESHKGECPITKRNCIWWKPQITYNQSKKEVKKIIKDATKQPKKKKSKELKEVQLKLIFVNPEDTRQYRISSDLLPVESDSKLIGGKL